jgi:hypothetical protein
MDKFLQQIVAQSHASFAKAKMDALHEAARNLPNYSNSDGTVGASGGGASSNCIEFVNNTTDGNQCTFWIETSASTNYTITWGDGETSTGEINGVDQLTVEHTYADADTEYSVKLCFDDASLVTYLEFNGDD